MALSAWLVTMPEWLSALLVVGFFVLFTVGTILIVRRLVPHSVMKPHNDITGFTFSTVGVIYGVMLAFVVIDVWEKYGLAAETTDREFEAAYSLYRDLNLYPNRAEADKVLAALRVFTLSVVHDEFPAMKAMKWTSKYQPHLSTHKASSELWAAMEQIVPRNLHEQSIYNEILKDLNNLSEHRVKRRLMAQLDLPGIVWVVVVLGGLATGGFLALFGHENTRIHILSGALLALILGMGVSVVVILNFPFVGDDSIGPDGYEFLIALAGW